MKWVAKGIYKTATGYRVFVRVPVGAGRSKLLTKRFPASATLTEMKAWREDQRSEARKARPKGEPGTLSADIDAYLRQVAAMPTFSWRQRDLEAWRDVYGGMDRANLTAGLIREQLHTWRTKGPVIRYNPRTHEKRTLWRPLSVSACNHRRTALLHLFTTLDGKAAPNPVRDVKPFKPPAVEPRARDLGFLTAAIARMRNQSHRAIARVLLWTGNRGNCELGKMRPEHLDLEHALCHIPTGKGGDRYRPVPLNPQGVQAWQDFAALKLWGPYDRHLLRKAFQRACKAEAAARGLDPTRVRPYDLRHSVATAYRKAGADLADIQELLGHASPRMTKRYAEFHVEKLAKVTAKL